MSGGRVDGARISASTTTNELDLWFKLWATGERLKLPVSTADACAARVDWNVIRGRGGWMTRDDGRLGRLR